MDRLLTLYRELSAAGARFYDWDLQGCQAATIRLGTHYGIFLDLHAIETRAEELVDVAHEGGHFSTGATHKLSSPYDLVEKHEVKAWKWAVDRLIPAEALDEAVAQGYTTIYDLADYFGVTEDFMKRAVCLHTYGNVAADLYF